MAARAPGAGQQAVCMGSSAFAQQQPGQPRCCTPQPLLVYPKTKSSRPECRAASAPEHATGRSWA